MKPHSNPALNNLSCTAAIETDTSDCRTKCDVLLTPAVLTTAPLHSEFTKADNRTRCSENDVLTLAVNMAGVPAISLPVALSESSRMPIGLQLIASNFQENVLFKAARFLESSAQFPGFASWWNSSSCIFLKRVYYGTPTEGYLYRFFMWIYICGVASYTFRLQYFKLDNN